MRIKRWPGVGTLERERRPLRAKVARRLGVGTLFVILLLVAARLAFPYAILRYVNNVIDGLPGYSGSIEKIRVSLWRGAYTIIGPRLFKEGGGQEISLFAAEQIDLSLEWGTLLRGALRGEIAVDRPSINIVASKSPRRKQSATEAEAKTWQETVEELFPVRIDRFEIRDGSVSLRDETRDTPIAVRVKNLDMLARNLTNAEGREEALPASLRASARVLGQGLAYLNVRMDPLNRTPTFDLDASLRQVPMTGLNDFLRAYGRADVQGGTFNLFVEAAAAGGRVRGYAKPIFHQLKIAGEREREGGLRRFRELIIEGVK
ncbi:MAG: DUF748 domain-containing protein [Elusimicrobia bacterium]|nr:DUF748 domain-containing protein [Elusimicrobiota bacterium]